MIYKVSYKLNLCNNQ